MADRWIISTWKYKQHRSRGSAEKELKRLREQCPKKKFQLYRIKTTINASQDGNIIKKQQREIEKLHARLKDVASYHDNVMQELEDHV